MEAQGTHALMHSIDLRALLLLTQAVPVFSREMSQRQLYERTLWLTDQKRKLQDESVRCSNLLNRMLPAKVVKQLTVRWCTYQCLQRARAPAILGRWGSQH